MSTSFKYPKNERIEIFMKTITLGFLGGLVEATLFFHFEDNRSFISYWWYFLALLLFATFIVKDFNQPLLLSLALLHIIQDLSHVYFYWLFLKSWTFWPPALIFYPVDIAIILSYLYIGWKK